MSGVGNNCAIYTLAHQLHANGIAVDTNKLASHVRSTDGLKGSAEIELYNPAFVKAVQDFVTSSFVGQNYVIMLTGFKADTQDNIVPAGHQFSMADVNQGTAVELFAFLDESHNHFGSLTK